MTYAGALNGLRLMVRRLILVLRRLVGGAALVYTLAFLAWRGALVTPLRDQVWQLQLSEVFAVWLYAPAALLLVAALVLRSRLGWVLVAPLVWFGMEYGGQFAPHWPAVHADAAQPSLRVMTWNTFNSWDQEREFVTTVRELQPDLIALQEVGYGLRVSLDELADQWPYQVVFPSGSRGGMALISRFPIHDERMHYDLFSCQCLQAVVEWHGHVLQVIVVHLWRPTFQLEMRHGWPIVDSFSAAHQDSTFTILEEQVTSARLPVLVMGDFNTTEQQRNYRRLGTLLENAWQSGGWGFGHTFPRPGLYHWIPVPLIRIDHIWHDPAWRTEHAWTGVLQGSDHLYLVADLAPPATR